MCPMFLEDEMTNKEGKKKKQHYVPQCYLERWAIPDTHQINVFDKFKQEPRKNNISDVAQERFFYDINFQEALSEEEKSLGGFTEEELEDLSNNQYFENFFSDQVEDKLATLLRKIILKAEKITSKKQKYIHFISIWNKAAFSYQLALQHIRTKATRNAITEISDVFQQVLIDMSASERVIGSMKVSKDSSKLIHGQMIGNRKEIRKSAECFSDFIWILGINRTDAKFLTSDRPICTIPHIQKQYMSMSGIMSEGVEVFYPLSPDIILVMFDRRYHIKARKYDRHCVDIHNKEVIEYYNSICVLQSERCVFSQIDDFSLIDRMLMVNKDALKKPPVTLYWGGKVYTSEI